MLRLWDAYFGELSIKYLKSRLACDETANYLVIWCLDLEMEEKHDLMAHVAHQVTNS